MDPIDILKQIFPSLPKERAERLCMLPEMYKEWNGKINLISRKDIDNVFTHHILHSLSIALFIRFKPGTKVLDIGTGGGFPAVPLAIMFPEVKFIAVDSIAKKIRVLEDIQQRLSLDNLIAVRDRAENLKLKVHFVVSRAALKFPELKRIAAHSIDCKDQFNGIPNGLIMLKGGDLREELSIYKRLVSIEELSSYIDLPYFENKKIVYLPI